MILHEETRQMFVYVQMYVVAPIDVFFAFVTVLVLLFCFSNRPREVKNLVAGSKFPAILKPCIDVLSYLLEPKSIPKCTS